MAPVVINLGNEWEVSGQLDAPAVLLPEYVPPLPIG